MVVALLALFGCEARTQSATKPPESSADRGEPSSTAASRPPPAKTSAPKPAPSSEPGTLSLHVGKNLRDDLAGPCEPAPEPPPPRPGLIAERTNYGRYFVRNNSNVAVHASGQDRGGVTPIKLDIAPGDTIEVWRVSEGSGGHVRPSNFFDSIQLTKKGGSVAYSGVRDLDWKDLGDDGCGASRYLLTLQPTTP